MRQIETCAFIILVVTALLVGVVEIGALEPENRILMQSDSPLEITAYEAQYQTGGRYSRDGIRHEVTYRNSSDRTIVAIRIAFVSFSIFNEFLDRTGGIDIDELGPRVSGKGSWVASSLADFSFHTGVSYVSKVRFANGEIWEADIDHIAAELRKIEEDFDASVLEGSTSKD